MTITFEQTKNATMIVFHGRIPSKKDQQRIIFNKRTRRPFILPSKNHAVWHRDVYNQLLYNAKQSDLKYPLISPIKVTMKFYFPDNRRADMHNKAESIFDILVDAEVIGDDSWQHVSETKFISCGVDKNNPRIEVVIIPFKNKTV